MIQEAVDQLYPTTVVELALDIQRHRGTDVLESTEIQALVRVADLE